MYYPSESYGPSLRNPSTACWMGSKGGYMTVTS
jgi:hypothetical protein